MDRITDEEMEDCEGTPLVGIHSENSARLVNRLVTVEPFLFLYCAAMVPIFSILGPQYIQKRVAQEYNFTSSDGSDINSCEDQNTTSNPNYKTRQNIAEDTAYWLMISTSVTFLPAIFITPFYGALSDRLGRKLNLFLPLITSLLSVILNLVVMYNNLPIVVFALAGIFSGFGGGYCYFIAGCYAYIAEITDANGKSRIFRMTVVSAVEKVGLALMPLIFGYIVDFYGLIPAMWVSLTMNILAILYLIIPGLLPEIVGRNRDTSRPTISDLISNAFSGVLKLLRNNTKKRRNRILIFLAMFFLTDIVQLSAGALQVFTVFGLGPPFCWSTVTLGYFSFVYFASASIGMLIGNKLFSICLQDFWLLQIAYICGFLQYVIAGLAPSTAILFLGVIIGTFRGMDGPVINTIFSKLVSPDEQGVIFAVEASVQSLASFLAPLIWNPIYSATVDKNPSLVFYVMSCVFVILLFLSWFWYYYCRKVFGTGDTLKWFGLKKT